MKVNELRQGDKFKKGKLFTKLNVGAFDENYNSVHLTNEDVEAIAPFDALPYGQDFKYKGKIYIKLDCSEFPHDYCAALGYKLVSFNPNEQVSYE